MLKVVEVVPNFSGWACVAQLQAAHQHFMLQLRCSLHGRAPHAAQSAKWGVEVKQTQQLVVAARLQAADTLGRIAAYMQCNYSLLP